MKIKPIWRFEEFTKCKMIVFRPDGDWCWFFNHFQAFETSDEVEKFLEPFEREEFSCYNFEHGIRSRDRMESIIDFLKFLGVDVGEEITIYDDDQADSRFRYEIYKVGFSKK